MAGLSGWGPGAWHPEKGPLSGRASCPRCGEDLAGLGEWNSVVRTSWAEGVAQSGRLLVSGWLWRLDGGRDASEAGAYLAPACVSPRRARPGLPSPRGPCDDNTGAVTRPIAKMGPNEAQMGHGWGWEVDSQGLIRRPHSAAAVPPALRPEPPNAHKGPVLGRLGAVWV